MRNEIITASEANFKKREEDRRPGGVTNPSPIVICITSSQVTPVILWHLCISMAPRLADTEPPAAVLWAVKRNHDLNAWRPDLKYLGAWNESGECFSYVMWMGVPSRMMWMGRPSKVISCPVDTCILCGCACFTRSPRDQGLPFEQGILRASSHQSGVKLESGDLGCRTSERQTIFHTEETYPPKATLSF